MSSSVPYSFKYSSQQKMPLHLKCPHSLQPQHFYLIPSLYRPTACRYLDQAVTTYHAAHLPICLLVWKPDLFSDRFSS